MAYMDRYADGLRTAGVDEHDPMWICLSFPFPLQAPYLEPEWGCTTGSRALSVPAPSVAVTPMSTFNSRQAIVVYHPMGHSDFSEDAHETRARLRALEENFTFLYVCLEAEQKTSVCLVDKLARQIKKFD